MKDIQQQQKKMKEKKLHALSGYRKIPKLLMKH